MPPPASLFLGCVADDFTGASDAASFLAAAGALTLLCSGVPAGPDVLAGCDAAVIALKTRSAPVAEAVADSMAAVRFLRSNGARTLYSKYCSTFDCTPTGNIGPIADAAMDELDAPWSVLCPSLPVNGRTVRGGHLYVNGVALHESSMRNHPLNPMWDSFLPELMRRQSRRRCLVLTADEMAGPPEALAERLAAFRAEAGPFYIVPDYEDDSQGARLAELFGADPFLTGGSGLLEHLAARWIRSGREGGASGAAAPGNRTPGRAVLLSGSCSAATMEQIRNYREGGGSALAVDPGRILDGTQTIDSLWEFALANENPLLYSAGKAARTGSAAPAGPDAESETLERAMSEIGRLAVRHGFTRIFVAGGETSGAVTKALGFDAFLIGESVAPGVPLMVPTANRAVRIALKSGNFGQPDYFRRVLDMTKA